MHQPHIPQYTIQNRDVHIAALTGALWDMGLVHYRIREIGLLDMENKHKPNSNQNVIKNIVCKMSTILFRPQCVS